MNPAGRLLAILGLLINSSALTAGPAPVATSIGKENAVNATQVSQKYPQVVTFAARTEIGLNKWLNLQELAKVEIPENLSFVEKIGWSVGFLLHPAAYRSRVPIYGYKWNDVCRGPPESADLLDRITTGTDLVLGAVDWTIEQGRDSVNWYSTIEQACLGGDEGRTNLVVTPEVEGLAEELMSSVDSGNNLERFLLTTVPLRNVGVIGEYIGVCDAERIDSDSGSVCEATLGVPMLD